MLVSFNVEDLFVSSTFFPDTMNRPVLKYYIHKESQLLRQSCGKISDSLTIKDLRKKIKNIIRVEKNLEDFFPNIKIKEKAFEQNSCQLFAVDSGMYIKRLLRSDIDIINRLRKNALAKIEKELAIFDPLNVVGTIFLNMSEKVDRDSLFGVQFFRTIWENKEIEKILSDIFSGRKFGPSFFELKEEVMNETYRQVLLTSVDIQRRIRKKVAKYLSRGQGEKEMSFEGLLKFANLIMTVDSLDRISYHLKIDIPIYIVEGKTLSLFIPQMSKLKTYPYHVTLDTQYKRMVAHYASSVEPDMRIPYQDLILKTYRSDFENLYKIFRLFPVPERPLIVSLSDIKELGVDKSILKTNHNPFVTIKNSSGEWLLTTSILVHDAIFRFVWGIRTIEHFKKVGSSFEDEVAEYLASKFPDSCLRKHVVIHKPGPEEAGKKYEFDILFKLDNTLVCIECKDYALIEDPDDFRLIAQRIGILMRDCSYFDSKIKLLLRYFEEFTKKNPEFADVVRIIPVVVAIYPDLKPVYQGIPIITKYEMVRLLNFLMKTGFDSFPTGSNLSFKDTSNVTLTYRILKVDAKRLT